MIIATCDKCSREAEIRTHQTVDRPNVWFTVECPDGCSKCIIEYETRKEAIHAWNYKLDINDVIRKCLNDFGLGHKRVDYIRKACVEFKKQCGVMNSTIITVITWMVHKYDLRN